MMSSFFLHSTPAFIRQSIHDLHDRRGNTQSNNRDCEVHLVVSKIVAYRCELDELPSGMTGCLQLLGTGGDRLSIEGMMRSK